MNGVYEIVILIGTFLRLLGTWVKFDNSKKRIGVCFIVHSDACTWILCHVRIRFLYPLRNTDCGVVLKSLKVENV